MATLAESGFPNLADLQKRLNPDGSFADIVNVISKKMPLLDDVPWQEANGGASHRITQAYSLPSATWRKLNSGVAATKADVDQFDEACGILEDESKVDRDLVTLNGGPGWRASEDKLKKEGISQQFSTAVFYESASTNPERIHGLSPRYGATTGLTSSSYVFTSTSVGGAANSGTNCQSIWLITWEPRKLYGIYPKGTMGGLKVEDMGLQRVLDSSSNAFWAYVTNLQWKCGIAVEDYRYAIRFQWDPDSAGFEDDGKGLYLAMGDMLTNVYEVLPSSRFYMNRTTMQKLQRQLTANSLDPLKYIDNGTDGKPLGMLVPTFRGIPIRVSDSLVAETAVT